MNSLRVKQLLQTLLIMLKPEGMLIVDVWSAKFLFFKVELSVLKATFKLSFPTKLRLTEVCKIPMMLRGIFLTVL